MPLHKLKDFDPNYQDHFDNQEDILKYDLYSGNDKVGSVDDLLVDDDGRIRYLIINTGLWIFGKKVLLPVGRARVDRNDRRIYVDGLTREQVEQMPAYDENSMVDNSYEDRVRGSYRPMSSNQSMGTDIGAGATGIGTGASMVDTPTPVEYDQTLVGEGATRTSMSQNTMSTSQDMSTPGYNAYGYEHDDLYAMNDRDHQTLRLYEERLIAGKQRQKTGEVAIGKRVETEQAHVSVPIEKERVVIERVPVSGSANVVDNITGDAFNSGEVARVEVYEETPDIHKEAFVREEVRVRKEVEQETVNVDDTIRREELDMQTDGNPIVNAPNEGRNEGRNL